MGKLKRPRQKLHASSRSRPAVLASTQENETEIPLLIQPSENLFAGIDININSLSKKLNEDVISMKSFKSLKSDIGQGKSLTKKEKMRLRKDVLKQKIDTVNQLKKEAKKRKKRKINAIIGDTNPLHDALPSLESLLKRRDDRTIRKVAKPKAVQKSSQRKKKLLKNIDVYKKLLKSKIVNENPFDIVKVNISQIINNSKK